MCVPLLGGVRGGFELTKKTFLSFTKNPLSIKKEDFEYL
jgi:hypothetical protein